MPFDLEWSFEKLLAFVHRNLNGFELEIPYQHIGISRSVVDFCRDHLTVSYCLERVLVYSKLSGHFRELASSRRHFVATLVPSAPEELAETLLELSVFYSYNRDPEEDELLEINEKLLSYERGLAQRKFSFPEEVDDYYANLVVSGYSEIASESQNPSFIRRIYSKYPERKFGFWKSACSKTIGQIFYGGTECWIVPVTADIQKILDYYSGFDRHIILKDASIFEWEHKPLIGNEFGAMWIDSLSGLDNARECSQKALTKEAQPSLDNGRARSSFQYQISEFADVVIASNEHFRFVFFEPNKLSHEELSKFYIFSSTQTEILGEILGLSAKLDCDWSSIDDEQFEQLCYDIVSLMPQFDPTRISKMGKSRSRDGGRDIVAFTQDGSDHGFPVKYIFQCKLIDRNRSLSKSSIPEAANTIQQYGAKGYGVFTSGCIDSTLHDMLDGFSNHMHIDTEKRFSFLEMERFLARHPKIKRRYFNSG